MASPAERCQQLVECDEVLRPQLADADPLRVAQQQATFLTAIADGRQFDAAIAAIRAYHGLGFTDAHVRRVGGHAAAALGEAGADGTALRTVQAVLATVQQDLVAPTRPTTG